MKFVDLRSDTVTKPTLDMRTAMAKAEVGDDVYGEDPTVNELERKAAELLGKEAALFVPSGTMGNQLAIMTHTQPGQEIILGKKSHIFYYEVGALAKLSGVQARTLDDKSGIYSVDELVASIRDDDIHYPKTGLVCLENTHNKAGGVAISRDKMSPIIEMAHENNIAVHLDGARIFNAALELKTTVKDLVKDIDSVMFCLSKGLAAPVGSILAGSQEFIKLARKNRKMLGGGMRQAGIIAAAATISLEQMIERLELDHQLARNFADKIKELDIKAISLKSVNSNFVILKVNEELISVKEVIERLAKEKVKISHFGPGLLRAVIHKDISSEDIDYVISKIEGL